MKPQVSVIVPVLNRENLITRCLDSIVNQTSKPEELIVVDNGSTDSTLDVVNQWMECHKDSGIKFRVLEEKIPGACSARQKGLENASCDYVSFFDSDDEMDKEMLEKALNMIGGSEQPDIVAWKVKIMLLDGSIKIPTVIKENFLESHLIHTLLRPQGYIVKKDFINRAGGWKKPLKVWNDLELGFRLILQNPKISFVDEVLACIHSQKDSITGVDFSSKEGQWETTVNEMLEDVRYLDKGKKDRIEKILDYRKAILAACYYKERNKESAWRLLSATLQDKTASEKIILKFSYHYTRLGMRGAWKILKLLRLR